MDDLFEIGGEKLTSRLFIGTGKYRSDDLIPKVAEASGSQVITVAMRRVDDGGKGIMGHIPANMHLLPNTSGARTAEEAVRLARIARAAGCGNWIKIEVINDTLRLLPDGYGTAKATEILAKEGFVVFPYINPDLYVARACVEAGACCVMPLASPIGSNRGLRTKEMIAVLIDEMKVPVIVDAGLGKPSEACECMEMGAAACLVNTGIASARDAVRMAEAFGKAVDAGRKAYLAGFGTGRSFAEGASASSPLTGFLR
ncbi:MAG: thiazole synthase [Candidatus Desulfovibrio faecigallinarum]|uniref:thiazole synthase n=1 Tax=Desulfovibrio sp. An276 TaxID=1965618 RepID=UPI000B39763E|nr:thiazole synthase [Desulfovibrio sp. An276]MBU3831682.1 thiazole synthase [Candidatus Desulfovibrio faecigallinarum]OUO51182.1 thiazole synthase [Desulfovibrio sp. An276]